MADRLTALPYSPDMVDEVRHFNFGTEPYHREIADWLVNGVTEAMSYGTKVWLYGNLSGDIVGFGSLGETNWNYPNKKSPRVKVAIIPALGLRREFWGCPEDAEPGQRYSSQILDHLIALAPQLPSRPSALGLFVYPANVSAIKLYERHHFQRFHTQCKSALGLFVYPANVSAIKLYERHHFQRFHTQCKRVESGDVYHGYVRDIS